MQKDSTILTVTKSIILFCAQTASSPPCALTQNVLFDPAKSWILCSTLPKFTLCCVFQRYTFCILPVQLLGLPPFSGSSATFRNAAGSTISFLSAQVVPHPYLNPFISFQVQLELNLPFVLPHLRSYLFLFTPSAVSEALCQVSVSYS